MGIIKSTRVKNKLYRKYCRNRNEENSNKYKRYRNKLNHLIRITERHYYQNIFEQNRYNTRKTWDTIKSIINKKKVKVINHKFKYNNTYLTNSQTIATKFNEYFVNIGPNLACKIPKVNVNPTSYLKGTYDHSFFVNPVVEQEVATIIKSLPNKSPGPDELRADIIQNVVDSIASPLSHICNLSFSMGVFPNELKVAKITPIFKKDDAMVFGNYRPVSVLSVLSKVMERLMYNRLIDYLNTHKILYRNQFGFRKGYSTQLALILLVDKISQAIDKGEYCIGLFLDLSKAFDTIDHNILINKLYHYGIRGTSLEWFKSYLTDRKQYVTFNGENSERSQIKCGVPQGSILGPLLFLIYMNDLAHVSDKLYTILFADDTNLFLTGKKIHEMTVIFNEELAKLTTWLAVNKLSLNIDKTNYMIFKGKRKGKAPDLNIKIGDKPVKRIDKTKFLGVTIDDTLSWKPHLHEVANKVSKCIGILLKTRTVLMKKTLTMLYYAFAYPYFSYCNQVWGNIYNTSLDKLVRLQNKMVRIISNVGIDTNTNGIYCNLHILKMNEINTLLTAIHMHKNHHHLLPEQFSEMFTANNATHDYNTRQGNKLRTPKHNTNIVKFTIRSKGPAVWNKITVDVQDLPCHIFKRKIKCLLFENTL